MSWFKRFIKRLLLGSSPVNQPLEALDNIRNSEKENEFTTSRIDLIGSLFCNHLFGISNRTWSTYSECETGKGTDIGDDAGDFAWSRADDFDADTDSDEIGQGLTGYSNFSPIFNNDDYDNRVLGVNPASGLPMLDDCIDIHGNPYGTDASDSDSFLWGDHSLDLFGDDGLGVTASIDIFGSNDPWDS